MINVPESVKDLLHLDTCKKNIRIHFPNGERADICNDLIVKDSVKFTESLCSQDQLKFGLCEAAQFECDTVGAGRISNAVIEVFCEIYCDSSVQDAVWRNDLEAYVYPISYGKFVIDSAHRQADMIHRKIVAYGGRSFVDDYNKLEYLKANDYYWSTTYNPKDALFTIVNSGLFANSDALFTKTEQTVKSTQTSSDIQLISWIPEEGPYEGQAIYLYRTQSTSKEYLYNSSLGTSAQIDNLFEIYFDSSKYLELADEAIRFACEYGCTADHAEYYKDLLVPYWYVSVTGSSATQYSPLIHFGYDNPYNGVGYVDYYLFYGCRPSNPAMYVNIPSSVGGLEIRDGYGNVIASRGSTESISYSFKRVNIKSDYDFLTSPRLEFLASTDPDTGFYYHNLATTESNGERLSALIELCGMFGSVDRNNKIELLDIKRKFGLLPSTSQYPSNSLYPEGVTGGRLLPNDYQTCWYDDVYTRPFGRIVCVYKDSNNNDKSYIEWFSGYSYTSDPDSYLTYDISNNYYIRNYQWTRAQIVKMCGVIRSSIEGVQYVPIELKGRGLPYVQPGDTFEILTKSNDSITTIVLNRTLEGEQTLTDTYKSV